MNQKERDLISRIIKIRKHLANSNRRDQTAEQLLSRDFTRLYKAVGYSRDRFDSDLHIIINKSGPANFRLSFGTNGPVPFIKIEFG